ncbi:hypothetical protein NB689_000307 [Xanthomonas sacchari]|uniref:hypothetical protein n=1 Tax=Xanthomonas sacchari TaxID=56458 RepID=UPI002253D866|nr:hypothetical protein [Xanthomonas sacchari]MCW0404923.1 hypothetical protein [Xanthomonas sacchari]MCW0414553.1 hypothetical protein [Xanthomonas sacchari]
MTAFANAAKAECRSDFQSISDFYKPHHHLESLDKAESLLRLAHRFALHMSQLVSGAEGRAENQRIFLEEIRSDAVHLVHVLFLGDARAAKFYMRSIVENFWRHHYFKNHLIEYGWLHERAGFFLTMESLRDYCKSTKLTSCELGAAVGNLSNYFSALSGEVHSSRANSLVLRETVSQIILTSADSKKIAAILNGLSKDIILLVSVSEASIFDSMSGARRAYCLNFLDATRRRYRQNSLGLV